MEKQVDEVIAEGLVAADRVVQGVGHEQHGPVHARLRQSGEGARIEEKRRQVQQRADVVILQDGVFVVVVEAVV